MEPKRITLLLPWDVIEAAEKAAARQGKTRHNFLVELIINNIGKAEKDRNAEKMQEIAELQRVSISILARIWGERNPEASRIITEMMNQRGRN